MSLALKPRRRGVIIFYASIGFGVLILVGLPAFGLLRIDRTTERSHEYTTLTASVEQLSTGLLQLVTGPLGRYGTTRSEADLQASLAGIEQANAQIASIEARARTAEELGISEPVAAQLAGARAVLAPTADYLADIQSGVAIAQSPAAAKVVGAAGAILQARSGFASAMGPVEQEIDSDRRAAVREAIYLLLVAITFFVLLVFGLGALSQLRIRRVFDAEAAKRDSAERLASHRADVVNMASHELRNPLTALTISSQLLVRTAGTGERADLIQLANEAHVAALRCNALVNELLDLGRLDADRLQLTTGVTPLRPALLEAIAMSEAHHGERELQFSGPLEAAVSADPERLRVILRNLVDNAFKYSPPNSAVSIAVAEGNGKVRIDIRDQGTGVPHEARERIFQRFERLATPGHASGVGIGLFLSRELARRMNGEIRCRDCESGAEFELELVAA